MADKESAEAVSRVLAEYWPGIEDHDVTPFELACALIDSQKQIAFGIVQRLWPQLTDEQRAEIIAMTTRT